MEGSGARRSGSGAAAGVGPPPGRTGAGAERRERRAVIAGILSRGRSRDPGRSAHAAGTVADAPGVGQRGEDDAMLLGDALVVSAAAPADDPRCRRSDEHRRRALEREQERLHLVAERVVPPAPVAADDPVAWDDHRHRVPAEGAADGARGARVTNALGKRRVRDDFPERDARRLGEHLGLELEHPVEVHRHCEERAAAREVLPELLVRLLGVAARAPRLRAHTSPRPEARDPAVGRLDAKSASERLELRRAIVEPPEKADEHVARKNRLGEKLPELHVEVHRQSSSARLRIALPRASWLLTVLTEMPRILASSRYESPST